ncbi:LacI family DNA-binding transcriptional regulator [soil metagenome]
MRTRAVEQQTRAGSSASRVRFGAPSTMRDIARATGVSQSTVSRVLSGAPTALPTAERTRQLVVDTAKQLGYRPNPHARGLRGARTMLLGVIVRDITDPFFAGAIEAASIEAGSLGYNVVLGHAHSRADEAVALWAILEARHCDAILLFGDMRDQPALIEDLRDTTVPVVALWHGSRATGMRTVNVDNRLGMTAVLEHLTGLGHRRVAFAGRRPLGDIREREEAYLAFLEGIGESPREEYLREAANDFQGGVAVLERLMDLAEPPTAIVASTDVIAIGVLHAAQRRGLHVPRDLSVTGFDDIPVAAVSVPALTTVRMPTREMVERGVRMALAAAGAGSGSQDDQHPVLEPTLVARASTGPARSPSRGT